MKIDFHQKGVDPLYKIWNRIGGHMIIYIYSDGGSIVFHDKILPMKKGTLCYIGPDIYHYTLPDQPATYHRSKIYIPDATFRKMLELVPEECSFYKLFSEKSVVYSVIPEEMQGEAEKLFACANNAKGNLLPAEFLSSFFSLMTYIEKYSEQIISLPRDFIAKAIEYINFNYPGDISLDDVCSAAHVSKHYLCRRFRSSVGMTVMDYILSTRIAAAKKMLASSAFSVSEISERCGFSSHAYFCQAFKKSTGITPNGYRQKTKARSY